MPRKERPAARPLLRPAIPPALAAPSRRSVFRSAISDDTGGVDAGYLALFWSIIGQSIASGVVLLMGLYSLRRAMSPEFPQIIQSTGIALGAIAAAFATIVGAVGLFRAGDRPHPNTTTTSAQQTVVTSP